MRSFPSNLGVQAWAFALGAALYCATFEQVVWCGNLFIFFTGFLVVAALCGLADDDLSKLTLERYRNGEHLPLWLDAVWYIVVVGILAAHAWFWTAGAWVFIASIDLHKRRLAEREEGPA